MSRLLKLSHLSLALPPVLRLPSKPRPTIALLGALLVGSLLATVAAVLLTACGSHESRLASGGPVKVLSASPNGSTYFSAEPIRIHFERPVITADAIGPIRGGLPAVIEPAAELSGRFVDRQTLVLTPSESLASSTRYRVRLTGEIGERTGGYAFEFVSVPLEIEGIWGMDLKALPASPVLPLHFNQPTSVDEVAEKCKFASRIGFLTIPARATAGKAGDSDAASVVNVEPRTPLALDADYQLLCQGLAGVGGNEPMNGLFSLHMRTHPELRVASVTPDGKAELFADNTRVVVVFTTGMELEGLRKKIRLEPAVKGIESGWLNYDGTRYTANVELDVKTKYKLVIDGEAVDKFGQALGTDHIVKFATGNARPTISMETGIYAVEPSAGGYPVWTRNIGEIALSCAEVPEASVVKLLTSSVDYDPWVDASNAGLSWTKLGLVRKSHVLRPTGKTNSWQLSRVGLATRCGVSKQQRKRGGLYLAEVSSPDVVHDPNRRWASRSARRVLANVTNLGVLLKAGPASGLVWVTEISTGKPVANATVAVYSPKGKRVFSATSDRSGIVKLPGTTKLLARKGQTAEQQWEFSSYRSQRMITVVSKADDMAVVDGNWANGIQTWNFGVREDRRAGASKIRGFIQSDRGIYRPGETVKFKGLLREFRGARAPNVPQGRSLSIAITDSRGSNVYDKKHAISSFGGFDLEFPLNAAAPVGDYVVTAKHGVQTFRERFSVEEFRKVTFEINVDKFDRNQRLGQKLGFSTKTDYLFGAPVASADVKWNVNRRPHYISFAKFRGYGFVDYAAKGYFGWWGASNDRYNNFVASGEGRTDKSGRFQFDVADSGSEVDSAQDYIAELTVTDDTDQAVTKRVAVTAHPTDVYLGMHAQEWVQAVNMPFAINAVAITPSGEQIAKTAKLSLVRETRRCEWKKRGYRSYPKCKVVHDVQMTRSIRIPATGVATEKVLPKKPGEYVIRIEGRDSRGKKVSTSTYVWVLGKGEAFWSGDESARMSLIASKAEYQPGDVARLVPRTDLKKPTALVTLERDGIISAFVREMDSPTEGIEVPLSTQMAPNVFASVTMVSGRHGKGDRNRPRFAMGVVDLRVASDSKRLSINVETDKKTYQPGELVRGTVRVTSRGRPVVAELAVSVADEGVLQLIGYKTPDPMKSFYASWGLGVDNGTNWNRISRLNAPAGADPDAGGDSGAAKDGVRSNFVNSAYWAPALRTNSAGRARIEFRAPDNLTAFRIMAVAADRGARFGSADSRITVAKPLLAKPVLPRFLSEKDRAEVGVMVHNYTDTGGNVTVTAASTGAQVTPTKQEVRVPAGGSVRARFYAVAKSSSEASFQFALAMGSHRDALRVSVPIERALVDNDSLLARGELNGKTTKTFETAIEWPKNADPSSELTLTIDRTGLSELEPTLRSLIEYPYGCLEQTLSRFIPLTKVADLASSLDLKELKGPRLRAFLDAGAAKVVRHQSHDGHFSLWPGGPTYPHLTAYALYGLSQARSAGVKIDKAAYERGIRAIRKRIASTLTTEMDFGTAAMSAFLLAETGKADKGLIARLYERRANLPLYGRGFLLMAMHHAASDRDLRRNLVGELVAALEAGMVREKRAHREVMGSDIRSTAIIASALLLEDGRNPAIVQMVEALKKAQQPSGSWGTTQENIYGLIALADFARTRQVGSSAIKVLLGGVEVAKQTLRGGAVLTTSHKLASARGKVRIEASGPVSFSIRRRASVPLDYSKSSSNGFAITRKLFDPSTNKEVTRPRIGQILVAKVTVKSDVPRSWVAVVNPFPAGIEPLNTKLAVTGHGPKSHLDNKSSWRNRWDHTELRDREVRAFRDRLPAGETTLTYRVRVSLPGIFTAMPARVEAMYEPEINARTVADKVEIVR